MVRYIVAVVRCHRTRIQTSDLSGSPGASITAPGQTASSAAPDRPSRVHGSRPLSRMRKFGRTGASGIVSTSRRLPAMSRASEVSAQTGQLASKAATPLAVRPVRDLPGDHCRAERPLAAHLEPVERPWLRRHGRAVAVPAAGGDDFVTCDTRRQTVQGSDQFAIRGFAAAVMGRRPSARSDALVVLRSPHHEARCPERPVEYGFNDIRAVGGRLPAR